MFREIHHLYNIHTVLGTGKRWMVCPLPQHYSNRANRTPSFSVFVSPDGVQRFKCHGNCGLQGDVIDLVGYINMNDYDPSDPEKVHRATAFLNTKYEMEPTVHRKPKLIKPRAWREFVPPGPEVLQYAQSRGLTSETVRKFRVGQNGHWMSMPAFEEERLRGIKFRNVGELKDDGSFEGLRFWAYKGSKKALFNYDAVAYKRDPILVLKGEIPVMLCDQLGLLACAPTAGEGSDVRQWVEVLALSQRKVVVGDNDRDPVIREDITEKTERRARVLSADIKYPPMEYKDIDEWILKDPQAVGEIVKWL